MRTTASFLPLAVATLLAACSSSSSSTDGVVFAGSDLTMVDLPVKVTAPVGGVFDQAIDHPRTADGSARTRARVGQDTSREAASAAPSGTFKQHYWYTTEFADGPDSPVLFEFCGEAACSAGELGYVSDVAKVLHASIVALEHRYYGESSPFADLSLEHMKYLTVHNALEDAAAFEAFAKASLPLAGKWIAVGGSYSGMLAAFYRQKHPELVAGAWASSAPVNIQKSFAGYDALVSHALGPTCTLLFQQALDAAGHAFDDPAALKELSLALLDFEWTQDLGKRDFLSSISGIAEGDAQYGQQSGLCQALAQHAMAPLDGLRAYAHPPLAADEAAHSDAGPGPVSSPSSSSSDSSPPGIPLLRSGRPAPGAGTGDFQGSQWWYQTCTELGLFTVSNPDRTESILPSGIIDEAASVAECVKYVHSDPDVTQAHAEYYAPIASGQASNIYFVNGSLDPWSALGFTDPESPPPHTTVFVVAQGSHCTDLLPLKRDSSVGDFEARAKAVSLMRQWLTP
jgi:pimeloyl-ACP methyl ester carboxylesterase